MRKHLVPILFLYFTALAIRLVPLLFSSLPYNIDGFPLAKISNDVISSGEWTMGEYNTKLPIFGMIITMASLISSEEPLYFVQILIPLMTSMSVVLVYVLAYKITQSRTAAVFAGLFLALCGFYVFLTAAVMKQALGFTLLPLILYLYYEREDPRKRLLCAFLLILMPLLHHLTSLMVFSMITLIMAAQNIQRLKDGTWKATDFTLDVCLGPLLIMFLFWFYISVDMPFFLDVANVNAVALFLSVYFIMALLSIYLSSPSRMRPWFFYSHEKRVLPKFFDQKALFLLGAIFLLVLNHFTDIFAGTLQTKSDLLLWSIPYLILLFIGLAGLNVIRNTETRYRALVVAGFMAPISVMLFSFLWGLDPVSFVLLYRSFDFIDVALAISIGIAVSYSIARAKSKFTKAGIAAGTLSLILLTTPFAYGSVHFFDVENTTYQYEFESMTFVDQHQLYVLGTEQRVSYTIGGFYGGEGDGFLPPRLVNDLSIESYDYLLLEDRWTSVGAQLHPGGAVVVDDTAFRNTIRDNHLIYTNTAAQEDVYILKVRK
ncbi:MAG: hypothetical protein KAR39_01025 [Thermoplasmata archaeon]|nr:hypothetical protein [Thermoplasmata archaeon]